MTRTPGADAVLPQTPPFGSMNAVSRWSHTEPASAEAATAMRRTLTAWLVTREVGELESDIVLAVYEAVANSVEHAYPVDGAPGPVTIAAQHREGELTITVHDDGRWCEPRPRLFRGYGLGVLRAAADSVSIDHSADAGTTVTLRWDLHDTDLRSADGDRHR